MNSLLGRFTVHGHDQDTNPGSAGRPVFGWLPDRTQKTTLGDAAMFFIEVLALAVVMYCIYILFFEK